MKKTLIAACMTGAMIFAILPAFAQNGASVSKMTMKGVFVSAGGSTFAMKVQSVSPKKARALFDKKQVELAVNGSSQIKCKAGKAADISSFKAGDKLEVKAVSDAESNLLAVVVKNKTLKCPKPPVVPTSGSAFEGTVAGIDYETMSFNLQTANGSVYTISISMDTKFNLPGIENPSLGSLNPGDKLSVKGRYCTETKAYWADEVDGE